MVAGKGRGIEIIVGTDYKDRDLKRAQRDIAALSRQNKAALGPMGQLSAGMRKQMVPGFAALGAAAAAAGVAVVAFFAELAVKGIAAAAEEEKAMNQLAVALKNTGNAFRITEAEAFIDNLQRTAAVADDELRPALQLLVTATGNLTQSQDLLQIALDVSAATGRDLQSVAGALAMAANGQFTALRKLTKGALSPSIIATGDLALITQELVKLYGGAAAANAETFAGSLAKIKIGADELLEAFGEGFLEAFTTDGVDDFTDALRELEPVIKNLGTTIGNAVRDLDKLMKYGIFGAFFGDTIEQVVSGNAVLNESVEETTARWRASTEATKQAAEEAKNFEGIAHGPVSSALQATAYGLDGVAESAEDAEDAVSKLNDELNTFFGFLDQRGAARGYQASIDDLRQSLKENGKSFDINTEAGRANQEALDDVFDSALKVAEGQATAAEKVKTMEDAARAAAVQLDKTNLSEEAKRRLLQPFDDAIAKFKEATTETDNLKAAMEKLPKDIVIKIRTETVGGKPPGISAEEWWGGASGGSVGHLRTGSGKGSDTVPTMLTKGEIVIARPMVKRLGEDFFSQLNAGINPLAGMTPTATSGGGGLVINGGVNVTAAPGEKAEQSLPRALRRMSFLAGI